MTQDVSPFARRRGERARRALRGRRGRAALARGPQRGRRAGDRDRAGQALHRLLPLSPQVARGAPPRRARGAARAAGPALAARPRDGSRRSERSGSSQEVSDPAPGGEAAARRALDRFLDGPIRDYTDDHDALGRDNTSRLSPVPALRLRLGAGDRGAAAARRRARRRFAASSAGATSTTTSCTTSRATPGRSSRTRYRGRIKWSYAEGPLRGAGARAAPATRSSTPGCASCAARAGCTTAPGSWSARF